MRTNIYVKTDCIKYSVDCISSRS